MFFIPSVYWKKYTQVICSWNIQVVPVVQIERNLQRTNDSDLMALLRANLGRGCWVCCKKRGASSRPPQTYVQTFLPYSYALFYNPFLISLMNLRKHEQRSPLGFVETNNVCVSELIWFPLGLDYAPHKAEASRGVRNSEGGKELRQIRKLQTNPPTSIPWAKHVSQQCSEVEKERLALRDFICC